MQANYIRSAITPRVKNKYDEKIIAYCKKVFDFSGNPEMDDTSVIINLNEESRRVHFDVLDDYLCTAPRFVFKGNPDFRQPIVYTIFTRTGNEGQTLYLTYDRNSGSEERLNHLYSVGWGGHVDKVDDQHDGQYNTLYRSALREIDEELNIVADPRHPLVRYHFNQVVREHFKSGIGKDGILLDNTNTVGREHVAYITVVNLDSWFKLMDEKKIEVSLEASDMDNLITVGWLTKEEVLSGDPENWTKIYLKNL